MKKIIIISIVFIAFGMISNAHAISLTYGDSTYYVGSVTPGQPASEANEVTYINHLITLGASAIDILSGPPPSNTRTYDRTDGIDGPFPTAVVTSSTKVENIFSIDATGYEYILGKYGANSDGSYVWYLGTGFSGTVTLQSKYDTSVTNSAGLSHITAFNYSTPPSPPAAVPEPATMFLFGTGLIGLAGMRLRRMKK